MATEQGSQTALTGSEEMRQQIDNWKAFVEAQGSCLLVTYDIAEKTDEDKRDRLLSYLSKRKAKCVADSSYILTGITSELACSEILRILRTDIDYLAIVTYPCEWRCVSQETRKKMSEELDDPLPERDLLQLLD